MGEQIHADVVNGDTVTDEAEVTDHEVVYLIRESDVVREQLILQRLHAGGEAAEKGSNVESLHATYALSVLPHHHSGH